VFERCGFVPIETPAMENLSTLTGKYGEEGDQLIFKILNNGDFLEKADVEALAKKDSKALSFSISKKALRYDLTVPFARFVVMNQNELTFPFKRYQMQPVWRGDRPGRGRYQEFWQCDADIIGSDGLLNEVELVLIFDEALSAMGLTDFTIVLNNRKILAGMAEVFGISDRLTDFTVALDKLDKIGVDGVLQELNNRGFDSDSTGRIDAFLSKMTSVSSADETLSFVRDMLSESEIGLLGVQETEFIVNKVAPLGMKGKLKLDLTLARGLNYYTGAIFEVKARGVAIGSICGGGRYDDLTGVFGLPGMSGVGISFGADRIYDVLLELNLFPEFLNNAPDVVFANFGPEEAARCLPLVRQMRMMGLRTELYPDSAKMKKQFKYADDRKAKLMVIGGPDEWAKNVLTVKNMASGEQQEVPISKLIETVLTMIGH
jgi:histidyl-tRNA synthetase